MRSCNCSQHWPDSYVMCEDRWDGHSWTALFTRRVLNGPNDTHYFDLFFYLQPPSKIANHLSIIPISKPKFGPFSSTRFSFQPLKRQTLPFDHMMRMKRESWNDNDLGLQRQAQGRFFRLISNFALAECMPASGEWSVLFWILIKQRQGEKWKSISLPLEYILVFQRLFWPCPSSPPSCPRQQSDRIVQRRMVANALSVRLLSPPPRSVLWRQFVFAPWARSILRLRRGTARSALICECVSISRVFFENQGRERERRGVRWQSQKRKQKWMVSQWMSERVVL